MLLFLVHAVQNIPEYLNINDPWLNDQSNVQSSVGRPTAHALPNLSLNVDDGNAERVVSLGSVVFTMDEDSFLGQISNENFWRRKRRMKRGRVTSAQAKKRWAADIAATPRSGLLTSKPASGAWFGIFSGQASIILPPRPKVMAGHVGIAAGGYRTLCVRLSDGYYWPISFAVNRDQFLKDRKICKRSCAESVRLFVYRNSDGRPEEMVDLRGRRYGDLENAWRYRRDYSTSRKCSPHPWEEASHAKHRAYALMAKRSGGRVVVARLKGQRKLVRVGHVRPMSTIDLDYIGKAKFTYGIDPSNVPRPKAAGTGIVIVTAPKGFANRRQVAGMVDRSGIMRLGVKAGSAKSARAAKKPRKRFKSRRRSKWVSEAFGFD